MEREGFDHLSIRCPSLGGEVPFLYCRRVNQGGPCRRLPVCWEDKINILEYIERFFSDSDIEKYFIQPVPGRLSQVLNQLKKAVEMKEDDKKRQELITAIKNEAKGGKITCAKAWVLAEQFDCPRIDMGSLLNELKIKIINCQLGCF